MASSSAQRPLEVPRWTFVLRVAQAVFAILTLALTAYAASVLGAGTIAGYGITWFTFILTFIFLILGLFAGRVFPGNGKHTTHVLLALEVFTALWWLISCAVLARGAAQVTDLGTVVDEYCGGDDGCDIYTYITNIYGPAGTHAVGAGKAAAVFNGVEFVLFLLTLALCALAMRSRRRGTGKTGTELEEQHREWYNQTA